LQNKDRGGHIAVLVFNNYVSYSFSLMVQKKPVLKQSVSAKSKF